MATGGLVRRDRDRRVDTRGWLLFLMCFAMLIVSLDQYIVVVALPDIGRALGYSVQTLQLVVSAYAVASSGFLLLGGRAADLLGRRRMLATGLVLYAVASFAGGMATGPATQLTRPGGAGPGRGAGVPGDPGRRSRPPTGRGRTATARWGSGVRQERPGWWWACWPAACSPATSAGPRCSSSTCRWPSPRWP